MVSPKKSGDERQDSAKCPSGDDPKSDDTSDTGCLPQTKLTQGISETTKGIKHALHNVKARHELPTEHGEKRKYRTVPNKYGDNVEAVQPTPTQKREEVLQTDDRECGDSGNVVQSTPTQNREKALQTHDGECGDSSNVVQPTPTQKREKALQTDDGEGQKRKDRKGKSEPQITSDTKETANEPLNSKQLATKAKPALKRAGGVRHGAAGRTKDKKDSVIVVPPVVEFLVRDSTILITTCVTAVVLLYRHRMEIWANQALPFPVVGAWLVLAFLLGHKRTVEKDALFAMEMQSAEERAVEAFVKMQAIEEEEEGEIEAQELEEVIGKENASIVAKLQEDAAKANAAEAKTTPRKKERYKFLRPGLPRYNERRWIEQEPDERLVKEPKQDRRHTMFVNALEKYTSKLVVFAEKEEAKAQIREEDLPPGFWTNLLDMPSRERQDWEVHSGETCDKLMTRLLKDPGQFKRTHVEGKEIVDPLPKFRGVDVFLSDANEMELSKRSILDKCGLRDKPMAMVHLLCPFASIVIYFELPSWVDEVGGLEEKEDDQDEVKAIKRFIKGDDEYRNKRLKIYPVLLEGPMAVRMLFYPPSKEFCIWGTMLPVSWYEQKPTTAPDGQKKSLVVECCVDVVSNRLARSTAQVLGSSLINMRMDVAAVIGTPDGQKEKEPEAFIGMWSYNHIDLNTCPRLPPKSRTESIMEASALRNTLSQCPVGCSS